MPLVVMHSKTFRPCPSDLPSPATDKITALCWSPDGVKLAVATVGRSVLLYDAQDGTRRDKFATKPAIVRKEAGEGGPSPGSYFVKALAFSPDSAKLAVAQSDGGVYVYKLGVGWGSVEKKSICHKFLHGSPVTALAWPPSLAGDDALMVYGLAEGVVVGAHLKSNKATALSSLATSSTTSSSYVVAVALHPDGASAVVTAHYNGELYVHSLPSSSSSSLPRRLAQHPCAAFALAWTGSGIVAAGNDQRVVVYHAKTGQGLQTFDYASSSPLSLPCKDFTAVAATAHTLVLGNFDSLYVYSTGADASTAVAELGAHHVPRLYSPTALAWHPDGQRLAVGSVCGVVDVYECSVPPPPPPPLSPEEQLFAEARALGLEQGIRLLQAQHQLEAAVDHAVAGKDFAYALKLCDLSLPKKLGHVHHQHALHLQQNGAYAEAEAAFLHAKAPREAIDMYLQPALRDYASARHLAEAHEPSLLPSILEAQASALLQSQSSKHNDKDAAKHAQAEALYVAAGQPERAVHMYMEAQRWVDALRVAQQYLPPPQLLEIVAVAEGDSSSSNSSSAKKEGTLSSVQLHSDILSTMDAKDLTPLRRAVEFLGRRQQWDHVWSMLTYQADKGTEEDGGQFQALRDNAVAVQVEQILGGASTETQPSFAVLRPAMDVLKARGGPLAHLELYQRLVHWLLGGGLSHAEEQTQQETWVGLVHDLRQVMREALRRRQQQRENQMKKSSAAVAAAPSQEKQHDDDERFAELFFAIHYTSHLLQLCGVLDNQQSQSSALLELACKVALTLLHYTPSRIPLDKAFYTAGTLLRRLAAEEKSAAYKHLAFLLLNRYVDLAEAIEDRHDADEEEEDHAALIDLKPLAKCTALPQEMTPLPTRQYVEEAVAREEIKAWVLSMCADKACKEQKLPLPSKAKGTLFEGLYAPAPGGTTSAWCALTGFPIHGPAKAQAVGEKLGDKGGKGRYKASKQEWSVWTKTFQTCPWTGEKVG